MKQPKSWTAVSIVLVSIAWPFLAVCLSAHQMIQSDTERWTCLLCYPGALLGTVYFWSQILARSPKYLNIVYAILMPICAVTIVFQARRNSDRMFTYWMMRRVSAATWQQVALDINSEAKEAASRNEPSIPARDLPQSVHKLGQADKFWGADSIGMFGNDRVGVRLVFGNRNRKWGLLVGPSEFLSSSLWTKYKRTPVATNAQFFVGSDW